MSAILRYAALLGALFLAACGPSETPVERANRDGILLRANGAEPAGLDPHLVTGVTEQNILTSLLEGLVRPEAKTLNPLPATAETWEISDDGRTYTFTIRESARWSNGEPVTASDFVFSYQRMLSPKLGADYAALLYPMENAEAYHRGEITDFEQVGVEAVDERTLKITLNEPTPYFLSLLTHYTWFPVHPETILAFGEIDERGTRWTRPGNFVGNGPFALQEWNVHELIDVSKSPTYWGADQVALNGIRFLPIDNINTEERAFRAGQVHVTNSVPLPKIPAYQQSDAPELFIAPYLGTYYYALNVEKPPLNDVRVRQALALAIDRKALTDNVLRAGQIPAYCFTPPNTAGYTAEARLADGDYPANLAEAKRLLAEAGFPGGESLPEIELLYNTSESHKIVAEAIQRMWQDGLGIDARLVNQDWKVYLQTRREGTFEIARAGWIGDYVDPSTFLNLMASWSGNNYSNWSNADYDALIREAGETTEPSERYELFQRAEAILMEELPLIPIYFYVSAYLVNPSVEGWHANILDQHPYQDISLSSSASE